MKRRILSLLLIAGVLHSAAAAGLIVVDEAYWPGPTPPVYPPPWPPPRPHPRPLPPPPRVHAFAPLEVTRHQAEVRIQDQVATTSIEQDFYNPNPRRMEGSFLLPVPKGAVLEKFTLEIDGKPVEAELLKADKARNLYEDIVRKLKDPALLEYAGQDVYKVRIFPIEPRATRRVAVRYTQVLRADAGLVSYTYPLGPEKFASKPIPHVSLRLELETGRPLKNLYSPSHEIEIRRHGNHRATVGFEAKDVRPENDFQFFYASEADEIGASLLTYQPPNEDGYFLLLAAPDVETDAADIVPKDVAFVLDTSGSMAGKKLEQAKKALSFCVANLNNEDRFEIIRFSTEAEPFLGGLLEATAENRERADAFIAKLKASGGTAIDEALQRATALRPGQADRPFVVIFLTDGLPTVGVTREDDIIAHVRQSSGGNIRIFCFGIGHDVNTYLLDHITEETRAFSQYVLPDEDLEIKVSSFYTKIKDPVLTRPTLKFSGNVRASKLYPFPLPDLFRGEQLILAGRYSGQGPASATLEGSARNRTRTFVWDLSFPRDATDHDFIPRLWATRRVGYLLDEIRLHGENAELRDEITELARRYGIVTPYTAYLIMEDEARRNIPEMTQSLPHLQQDQLLREQTAAAYRDSMTQRYGLSSVARARSETALKAAAAPESAVALSYAEGQRAMAGGAQTAPASTAPAPLGIASRPPTAGPAAPAASAVGQVTRYVAGRTFYLNQNQWIDSQIQGLQNPKRIRIALGSDEYFELLARHPEIRDWLALGQNVQFVLEGTVYEIAN